MLSDRWIQHQRKQNRHEVDQQNQKPYIDEIQYGFCRSSIKACTADSRKDSLKNKNNLDEPQVIRPKSSKASEKRPTPARTILITDDTKVGKSATKPNVAFHNNIRDDRGSKRAAREEGISSSGSNSLCQQVDTPSPLKLKTLRTSISHPHVQRRSNISTKSIWLEGDIAPTRIAVDQSNIASVAIAKKRNQLLQHTARPLVQSMTLKNNSQTTTPPNLLEPVRTDDKTSTNLEKPKFNIVLQLNMKPLTQEQLIARVKSVYSELVTAETKCISFYSKPDSLIRALTRQTDPDSSWDLSHEGIRKLITLHRKLLYQYHDFFLVTQHPLACFELRRLASKYTMPARLWRHGIHSFLELLRHLLPSSLEYMLMFIYLSYSIIALLFETVSVFKDTWIECLGDLSRYRMAIEDDSPRDREIWTNVSRHWYIKASNNAPTTGRLYHHLAILASPSAIEQLFYYSKSLCSPKPFTSARESILALFEPILKEDSELINHTNLVLDDLLLRAHGILFTKRHVEHFSKIVEMITELLYHQIKMLKNFKHHSYLIAIINCSAMLEYGSKNNVLMNLISRDDKNYFTDVKQIDTGSSDGKGSFENAQYLCYSFFSCVIGETCLRESEILPYIHVTLVFIYFMGHYSETMAYITSEFPWESLATKLNGFFLSDQVLIRIEDNEFPYPEDGEIRPFPEDYAMRGFVWAINYFPSNWFMNDKIDEQEKYHEYYSLDFPRKERILWLAHKIVSLNFPLKYKDGRFYWHNSEFQESAG